MRARKTAKTSRISYAIGMREGLFSKIERTTLNWLKKENRAASRREISRATGIEIGSLCRALQLLTEAGTLAVVENAKDEDTHREVMLFAIND